MSGPEPILLAVGVLQDVEHLLPPGVVLSASARREALGAVSKRIEQAYSNHDLVGRIARLQGQLRALGIEPVARG